jgi:hypothetical protein
MDGLWLLSRGWPEKPPHIAEAPERTDRGVESQNPAHRTVSSKPSDKWEEMPLPQALPALCATEFLFGRIVQNHAGTNVRDPRLGSWRFP